mmetsp:Transcript_44126/g.95718  ORF Transcript_44126/g.95718 Transcript_44126/m.95718 type:complete len:123 (-) Transcript_44126:25-393(-)
MTRASSEFLWRKMFISTEDPEVINDVKGDKYRGWTFSFIEQLRMTGAPTWSDHTREKGASEEFLSSVLNLIVALECDGYIGTIASNWNRLIDELRRLWAGKAYARYVEVGQAGPQHNWFYWW